METEIWKDILGYEGLYQISSEGRVKTLAKKPVGKLNAYQIRRLKKEKILKGATLKGRGNYRQIALSKSDIAKTFLIHRLVAEAFLPNPENKPQVNHINGIKNDNRLENLEWCTTFENMAHAVRIGLHSMKGERHNLSRLKDEDVLRIRELGKTKTADEITTLYNVSKSNIAQILCGKTWSHLPYAKVRRKPTTKQKKLNENSVREIRNLKGLYTPLEVAKMFNVSVPTIYGVWYYQTWKHVI